ncbi:hypothetical protein C1T28_21275, partial [Bacillus subtilis]
NSHRHQLAAFVNDGKAVLTGIDEAGLKAAAIGAGIGNGLDLGGFGLGDCRDRQGQGKVKEGQAHEKLRSYWPR